MENAKTTVHSFHYSMELSRTKKKSNLVNQYKTIANNTLFEVDLKIITNPIKVIFFTCLNDKRRRGFGFLID